MERTLDRLKIAFIVVFVLCTAAWITHHQLWAKPRAACEAGGGWWAPRSRTCGTPIDITKLPRVIPARPAAAPQPAT